MYSKLEVNLKNLEDITDPFKYDGSYEVVRRAAELYSESFDKISNDLDDKDLDVILFLDLGSWKLSYEKKKERIMACHLLDNQIPCFLLHKVMYLLMFQFPLDKYFFHFLTL